MRWMLGGERSWWLSMGLLGVVGALVLFLSHMRWGFGSIFVWGGKTSNVTLDLTQGLDPRSVFGRIFGVGSVLSKTRFLVSLALLDSKRRPLQTMCSVPTVLFSGTLCLLTCYMTGRWRCWPRFAAACIVIS
jgi:hypothetical protein